MMFCVFFDHANSTVRSFGGDSRGDMAENCQVAI